MQKDILNLVVWALLLLGVGFVVLFAVDILRFLGGETILWGRSAAVFIIGIFLLIISVLWFKYTH